MRTLVPLVNEDQKEHDLEEFLRIVRRALLMIVRWIEKRYGIHEE